MALTYVPAQYGSFDVYPVIGDVLNRRILHLLGGTDGQPGSLVPERMLERAENLQLDGAAWQRQHYRDAPFISHHSLLAPGGMQVHSEDTDAPLTRLGVHPFHEPTLHTVLPTVQAE